MNEETAVFPAKQRSKEQKCQNKTVEVTVTLRENNFALGSDKFCAKISDMSRELILQKLQAQRENLRQAYGVQSLVLFGSVARSTPNPTSDIDLLVTFSEAATFDQYMNLKLYLEDILQSSVDLVTKGAVLPHIMPKIEREGVHVA